MENYFVGIPPGGKIGGATIWTISDEFLQRVGQAQCCRILSEEPLAIEHHVDWEFVRLSLRPGQYFPRMARPADHKVTASPGFNPGTSAAWSYIQMNNGQLFALVEQIEKVFRVVHPDPFQTMNVFGHEIRNLLMLAAMEVETSWRAILTANGSTGNSTNDYVKLLEPMKLDEYELSLQFYPWVGPIRPFAGWRTSHPTKSLPWYHAYNQVKHDRETHFSSATLRNALEALCGCFVMMCAQFGQPKYWSRSELRTFFNLSKVPSWKPSDFYCRPFEGEEFVAVNHTF
ncbi:hypothetical protein [Rhodopseudomonas palustris]|uniref:Uncharacterized protein n=1 Tax=Rhodopseudomonas palustris (strain BisB18) TaxID=316056 RepID=Q216H1_RHOPB